MSNHLLQQRHIVLGVCGGIAAYKAADLSRRLRQAGAEVRVVMTAAAQAFITPLSFQALTGHPVHRDLLDEQAEAAMGHIELARWADAVLIAPASADCMARLAGGRADDLLTTLCLATEVPIALAPAMNRAMWQNQATQANARLLSQRGMHLFGPAEGEQACGETGPGRMLEPPELTARLAALFGGGPLAGKTVLITAGPTHEALDPVRFIGNRSSGKMGYAVAEAARKAGARVVLVSGPVSLPTPCGVERVDVESARQMHDAVMQRAGRADVFIAVAAVADYRPVEIRDQKIKKSRESLQLRLTRTRDILADVAALADGPFTVGFAAETRNVVAYARDKMERKGIDVIAANQVGQDRAFGTDENRLDVLWSGGGVTLGPGLKTDLADALLQQVARLLLD